eukprot:GILK01007020.1.p1 GENE.GILK01007020.1~~GILK01007020.1.p1  ORF type:complete len:103 (-),score=11.81 GILK01007020.1:152-436(-)
MAKKITFKTRNETVAASSSSAHKRVVVPKEVRTSSLIGKVTGGIEDVVYHSYLLVAGNFLESWEYGLAYAGWTALFGLCGYIVVKGVSVVASFM